MANVNLVPSAPISRAVSHNFSRLPLAATVYNSILEGVVGVCTGEDVAPVTNRGSFWGRGGMVDLIAHAQHNRRRVCFQLSNSHYMTHSCMSCVDTTVFQAKPYNDNVNVQYYRLPTAHTVQRDWT